MVASRPPSEWVHGTPALFFVAVGSAQRASFEFGSLLLSLLWLPWTSSSRTDIDAMPHMLVRLSACSADRRFSGHQVVSSRVFTDNCVLRCVRGDSRSSPPSSTLTVQQVDALFVEL